MEVKIDYREIDILRGFFRSLELLDQRKVLLAAFRKSVKPLIKAAKRLVPQDTGKLMRSIGALAIPRETALLVGAKRPKGSHGHLLEEGTKIRKRKSGGSTGKIKATKWFETAFRMTSAGVYKGIDQEWYMAINRMIIKTNKKLKA